MRTEQGIGKAADVITMGISSKYILLAMAVQFVLASPATTAPAQSKADAVQDLTFKGSRLTLTDGTGAHAFDLSKHIATPEIDKATILFNVHTPPDRYLVVEVSGYSKGKPQDHGECGAGTEGNIVWMHLNDDWKVEDVQSLLIDSCLNNVVTETDAAYKIEQGALIGKVEKTDCRSSDCVTSVIRFLIDPAHINAGIDVEELLKTPCPDLGTTAGPDWVNVMHDRDKQAGEKLFDATNAWMDAQCTLEYATFKTDRCRCLHELEIAHRQFFGEMLKRLDGAPDTVKAGAAADLVRAQKADARLNQVYARLQKELPTKARLRLLDAQRRWIRYRDAWATYVGKQLKSRTDQWTLAVLTELQCRALETSPGKQMEAR